MTQRMATPEDIPAIVALGKKFHGMSPHRDMGEFDEAGIARMLAFMIESPQSVVLVNGTGVIGATYAPIYFCPSQWMCEENYWYADAGGAELLDGLIEHARGWGATHICLSTLENRMSRVIDRLLTRKGFTPVERRYIKELSP